MTKPRDARSACLAAALAAFIGCSAEPPAGGPPPAAGQPNAGGGPAASAPSYPAVWSATADPAAETREVSAQFPIDIEPGAEVSFPRAWPPLAYKHSGKRAELLDLRSGKSLGAVQDPEPLPNAPAVSADGKKMAAKLLKEGDHIRIWSFETGRVAGDRGLGGGDRRFGGVSILHFATSDRLVGVRRGVGGGEVVVMDLAQASQPRTFLLASPGQDASLASNGVGVSPAGKYIAAIVDRALVIHELESGQCVGTSELPPDAAPGSPDCKEIVFSPDGSRLATLLTPQGSEPVELLEWDAATGKLSQHKKWDKQPWLRESNYTTAHDEHPLVYLPDGSGWALYGRLVWNREADAPEPVFPAVDDSHPRSLLDADRVVARVQSQGQTRLQVVPRAGIELAAQPNPPKAAADWQAEPDPAAAPRLSGKPLAVFGNVPQPPRFSRRPGSFAACAIGPEYIVFDLEAGVEAKRFKPSTGSVWPIRDVSADGRFLAVAPSRAESTWKFEVWNVATGKLALQAEEDVGAGDESIEFVGAGKLVVAHRMQDTGQRHFTVWDVAKKERTQEFTSPTPSPGAYLQGSHVVSPGGELIVNAFQDAILVYDLASGELRGKAPLPQAAGRTLPQRVLAAAMTLDGEKLHVVTEYQPETVRLLTLDMATGQLASRDLDGQQLKSLDDERRDLHAAAWLPNGVQWLVCGQAAVNTTSGVMVGPLGLPADSSLVPILNGGFMLGHLQTGLKESPAAAVIPIDIQVNAGAQLVASVEGLRPKRVAIKKPKPKPAATASTSQAPPTTAEAPVAAPKRDWSACVDPPASDKPLTPAKQFTLPVARNARFVASQRGGSFVLVVDEDEDTAQVLDLASGKPKGGKFAFPSQTEEAAIDLSGKHVALATADNEVTIHDVESGKSTVVKRPGSFVYCRYLEFARGSQLLAAFENDDRLELVIWRPEGGEPVKRIGLSGSGDDWAVRNTGLAVSPGGRFVAALRHDGLAVYDLEGSAEPQATVVPFANTKANTIVFKCDGICFSPDGKRLAATYQQGQFDNVTIWSMESGDPLVFRPSQEQNHLRTITHSDYGPRLCWFADGESLLYAGSILLDAVTGCPYWVVAQDEREMVLPLTAQSLLAIQGGQTQRLVSSPLPAGATALQKAVRKAPAEGIPPLKANDARPPAEVARTVAGPPTIDALAAPLSSGPIRLNGDKPDIRPNRLAASPAGVLAVEQIVNYIDRSRAVVTAGALTPEREVVLETYDLASGKRSHRLDVPERSNLLDISPDGSLLLTGDELYGSGGYSRLDVWAPKLGKHAVGWRPLPYETDFFDVVTWAGFVDKKHVLVLGGNQLVCWRLPECRQVYALATDGRPAFSANRKLFLERKTGRIHDALSGKALATVEGIPSPKHMSLLDAAFTADGKTIVGVTSAGMSFSVVQWDAVTGKITSEFAIPPAPVARLALVGDRGALLLAHQEVSVHGGKLIDLEQRQIASAHQSNGVHGQGPGGVFWRTDFVLVAGKGAYFAQGFGPDDFTWPQLASPPPYAVIGPGSKIAIEFQSGLPEAEKLRTLFEEKVRAAGFEIDPSAAVKAVFTANQDRTVVQRAPVEVSIPVIAGRMAIVDASGAVAWETTVRQRHDESVKFDVLQWLESLGLPRCVFKPDWEKLIPKSEFPRIKT